LYDFLFTALFCHAYSRMILMWCLLRMNPK
jgi:hypothetical protein